MKKGVFTIMHYLMPKRGILSLHSGCNVGAGEDVTLFFGLSGTGKTTLSTDPRRPLIGDDEHCWGDNGVFNIEGGCYAKCINLQASKEPEIYKAIRFGTVLENVVFDRRTRVVDFDGNDLTENTRASYPIEYIDNARIPCIGPHPNPHPHWWALPGLHGRLSAGRGRCAPRMEMALEPRNWGRGAKQAHGSRLKRCNPIILPSIERWCGIIRCCLGRSM
ncbi:uncharacterized protein HaLaN_13403 [Haematococcus lacustris]|uniref:phosphoenolpyruvate carboxykinase (ATP) n=1 Tax=Haematococcus lacustris TaxID=44745 RepID=A0A699ZCF2_HAELA|nr:uncharacterized protein HaLaN_13403 [Haematococcus lacustris]